jgi:hypothetical protein
MDQVVVMLAEQSQIGEVGRPSRRRCEQSYVVRDDERHVPASRKAAVPVTSHQLSTLGLTGEAPLAALVHRVTGVVVDTDHHCCVAGDPSHRLCVDQAGLLELAEQPRLFVE